MWSPNVPSYCERKMNEEEAWVWQENCGNCSDPNLTLKYALSISACPIDRFGVGGRSSFSFSLGGSVSGCLMSVVGGSSSLSGVSDPHIWKLKVASLHCSMIYGYADSLRLPMIWREMSKPASCCRANNNQRQVNSSLTFPSPPSAAPGRGGKMQCRRATGRSWRTGTAPLFQSSDYRTLIARGSSLSKDAEKLKLKLFIRKRGWKGRRKPLSFSQTANL